MIAFNWRKFDKTNTPVISNEDLRSYAEAVVADYKPQLLKEPGKINGIHFLESYLGAVVDFQDIWHKEGEPIAGAAVFNDDTIPVFDREGLCVKTIEVKANTVILDNRTVKDGLDGFAKFTALHEGGHLCLHPAVYRRTEGQIGIFDNRPAEKSIVCCRKAGIGRSFYSGGKKFTPEQTREHQANEFAAFVAMPRQTFVPFAGELIRDEGYDDGIIIIDRDWEDELALNKIVNKLSEAYGVSNTAAKVHLKELNLLMNVHAYKEMRAQDTLAL